MIKIFIALLLVTSSVSAIPDHYADTYPSAIVTLSHCGAIYSLAFSDQDWSLVPAHMAMEDPDHALMVANANIMFTLKTDCDGQGLRYRVTEE